MSDEKPAKTPEPSSDEPPPPKFDIIGKCRDTVAVVTERDDDTDGSAKEGERPERPKSRAKKARLVQA